MSNAPHNPDDPFRVDNFLLRWLLRAEEYRTMYSAAQGTPSGTFAERALRALDVRGVCDAAELDGVPKGGALVIAANHPRGAIDGLVLADAVLRVRRDVRILTNYLLSRIPALSDLCFFVDPFDNTTATARNQAGLRAAHLWLRRGGALMVFPAGEVAHQGRAGETRTDSKWKSTIGRLVAATGASVVPAFIEGHNSRWFYAAGRIHPMLRTALLAREMLKARGSSIPLRFGRPLTARDCGVPAETADAAAITSTIRSAVDALRVRPAAIVDPVAVDQIEADIAALPPETLMLEEGGFQVYCTRASAIPNLLSEIGRLRELTYREAGEGTGRRSDLDEFDDAYLHLVLWDHRARAVVGAYRMGQTDRLMARHGVEGLYTRTLFRYDERLISRMSPALELGRSFVRQEYQRNYSALLSLWKGIGRFVVLNPKYRVLFGTVSVSARYAHSTHQLLMRFLSQNHRDAELAELAVALNPPIKTEPPVPVGTMLPEGFAPRSIDEINRLVSASEPDGKGVPVLLRQYLKLDAKLIGFNVDPRFGDALDALMMVDLTRVDRGILKRYLGREGAESFLEAHRARVGSVAA